MTCIFQEIILSEELSFFEKSEIIANKMIWKRYLS